MCGIVGFLSGFSNGFAYSEAKAFTDMLFVDTLRGFDSTGVFGVSNRGNVHALKEASNGASFIANKQYDEFISDAVREGVFLVGHNRAATRGEVVDRNAHPFWIDDNIFLVQNGTWKGSHKHVKDTEVDTEALAHIIAESETIDAAVKKIDAAYALVWYNVKEKSLNLLRNTERPLFISRTKNGGIMFASEPTTILFASSRQSIDLMEKPYMLADGNLVQYKLDDKTRTWEMEQREIDIKPDVSYEGYYDQWSNFRRGYEIPYQTSRRLNNYSSHNVHDLAPITMAAAGMASDIDTTTTIGEIIRNNEEFNPFCYDESVAQGLYEEYFKFPINRRLVIAFNTYYPANDHPNCRAWYIAGTVLTSSDDEPSPVTYAIMINKTEGEIQQMLAEEFYTVAPSTPVRHKIGNGKGQIVTVFVPSTGLRALSQIPTIKEENNDSSIH